MVHASIFLLASAAALGSAKPIEARDERPWDNRSVTDFCHLAGNLGFNDAQKSFIWGSDGGLGVGEWFDEWLEEVGQDDWLNKLREAVRNAPNGVTLNMVCNSLGADHCVIDSDDCARLYYTGYAPAYWIFRSVRNLHWILSGMNSRLTEEVLSTYLGLDAILERFGSEEKEEDTKVLDFLGAALGLGSALSSVTNPALSAVAGAGSALTGVLGEVGTTEEIDERAISSAALKVGYDSIQQGMVAMLQVAVEGYWKHDFVQLGPEHLPGLQDGRNMEIARFFDNGFYLTDDTMLEDSLSKWKDEFGIYAKQAIVAAILKAQHTFVFIDKDVDWDNCESDKYTQRRWIDGQCADLWTFKDADSPYPVADYSDWLMEDEKWLAMQESAYGGVDLYWVYKISIDCAYAYPDGDGAVWVAVAPTHDYAECFFNYGVFQGTKARYGQRWALTQEDGDINTTDRTWEGAPY